MSKADLVKLRRLFNFNRAMATWALLVLKEAGFTHVVRKNENVVQTDEVAIDHVIIHVIE